jgi:hypothetical protein
MRKLAVGCGAVIPTAGFTIDWVIGITGTSNAFHQLAMNYGWFFIGQLVAWGQFLH